MTTGELINGLINVVVHLYREVHVYKMDFKKEIDEIKERLDKLQV